MFQFYDSPIKSYFTKLESVFDEEFQFYDSPIKSIHDNDTKYVERCFNSMIVRLKADFVPTISIIATAFQFYDSPIKRVRVDRWRVFGVMFQFYDSPIKRIAGVRESVPPFLVSIL